MAAPELITTLARARQKSKQKNSRKLAQICKSLNWQEILHFPCMKQTKEKKPTKTT